MDVTQLLKWDNNEDTKKQEKSSSFQLTDKLIEKLFHMALPPTLSIDGNDLMKDRQEASAERPPLSIQTMSKNFIQLNSRLSAPFVLVNNVIYFFQWKNPFLTITGLLLYTNLVIHPIPLAFTLASASLLSCMASNFLSCYQPDANSLSKDLASIKVHKIGPIKPASEISQEFILNLTDLQNHMLLFVGAWDFSVRAMNKFITWDNETASTFIFLSLIITTMLFIAFSEQLLLWLQPLLKAGLILMGWGFTMSLHPKFYDAINDFIYSESTRLFILKKTNKFEELLSAEITKIDNYQEKEVQIFEVWRFNEPDVEWYFVGFKNTPFWPNDPNRIMYETEKRVHVAKPKRNSNIFDISFDSGSAVEESHESAVHDDETEDGDSLDIQVPTTATSQTLPTSSITSTLMALNDIVPPIFWRFKARSRWVVDLDPEHWVQNDLITNTSDSIHIDDESKFVYDLKSPSQPVYRRRRRLRKVVRVVHTDDAVDEKTEEQTKDTSPSEPVSGDRIKAQKTLKIHKRESKKTKSAQSASGGPLSVKNAEEFIKEQLDYMI